MGAPVLPEDQLDVPAILVPDRADAPISEITERFFRALLTRVPLDRIEEVHLFSPLRQGGVETGIAVIAAREIVPAAALEVEPLPLLLDGMIEPSNALEALEGSDSLDVEAESSVEGPALIVADPSSAADEASDDSPYADEPVLEELPTNAVPDVPPVAPVIRHTVYTARYRLVQKGPDRGKWESTVVAEAEAPLITVEMVVRGVQRRAGEESETTRFSAAQLARALRLDQSIA